MPHPNKIQTRSPKVIFQDLYVPGRWHWYHSNTSDGSSPPRGRSLKRVSSHSLQVPAPCPEKMPNDQWWSWDFSSVMSRQNRCRADTQTSRCKAVSTMEAMEHFGLRNGQDSEEEITPATTANLNTSDFLIYQPFHSSAICSLIPPPCCTLWLLSLYFRCSSVP